MLSSCPALLFKQFFSPNQVGLGVEHQPTIVSWNSELGMDTGWIIDVFFVD